MSVPKNFGLALGSLAIALTGVVVTTPSADAASGIYSNCTAMHKRWSHGVGRSNARDSTSGTPVTNFFHSTKQYKIAMSKNRGLDGDKDGIACERR